MKYLYFIVGIIAAVVTFIIIYDNVGHVHHPNIYKNCDVKGSMAVNLTWDDVQEFFTLIKGGNYGK